MLLGPSFGSLANLFTKDYAVLQIVKSGTWVSDSFSCLSHLYTNDLYMVVMAMNFHAFCEEVLIPMPIVLKLHSQKSKPLDTNSKVVINGNEN